MTVKCYACTVLEHDVEADTAFLAGMAFVGQFSNQAVLDRLCQTHITLLKVSSEAAARTVPLAARRNKVPR